MISGKRKHSEIKESSSILDSSDSDTLGGTPISPVKRMRIDRTNEKESNGPMREESPTPTDASVEEEENEVLSIIIPKDDECSVVKRDRFTEEEAILATDSSNSNAQVEDLVQSNESVTNDEQTATPRQEYALPTAVDTIPLDTTVFLLDPPLASPPTESFVEVLPPEKGPFNSPPKVLNTSQPALGTILSHSPLGLLPPASPFTMPASETLQA